MSDDALDEFFVREFIQRMPLFVVSKQSGTPISGADILLFPSVWGKNKNDASCFSSVESVEIYLDRIKNTTHMASARIEKAEFLKLLQDLKTGFGVKDVFFDPGYSRQVSDIPIEDYIAFLETPGS